MFMPTPDEWNRKEYVRNFKNELKRRGLRNIKVKQKNENICVSYVPSSSSPIVIDNEFNQILEIREKLEKEIYVNKNL